MSGLNQKEYLKKYLGIGKRPGEKKKKKKSKKTSNGLRIVDDDIGVNLNDEIKIDLAGDNEDAPQIVSVIDDRPPSLRIDEVTQNNLWKPLGAPDTSSDKSLRLENSIKLSSAKSLPNNSHRTQKEIQFRQTQVSNRSPSRNKRRSSPVQKYRKSDDFSPPRRSKSSHNSDSESTQGQDNSPLRRKNIREGTSPLRRKRADSDYSPEIQTKGTVPDRHKDTSPIKKVRNSDNDSSPPRRSNRERSVDSSPPNRNRTRDEDSSPPRKIKREKSEDISPPRRNKTQHDNDPTPPRRIKGEKSTNNSPPRRNKSNYDDSSPRRNIKRRNSEDSSPPRREKENSRSVKKSRWGDTEDVKVKKTLDGKKAGLQKAADLVIETHELKKREDELFKNMSAEVSGANAATVVRGKKKEVDWEEEERRRKKEEENKEKYNKWGRGLKQVEDVNEKIKNDQYEMNKPLARYADDADLEKYLKDQEREGDPMLAYLRQKKKKKIVEEGGKSVTQQYEGDAPPNRFGIRPGYRWDGVDRSGGYEKQWFQVQNSRMASLEESYKWSTEDM